MVGAGGWRGIMSLRVGREGIWVGSGDLGTNKDGGTGALGWIWKMWEALGQESWDLGILGQERFDVGLWVGVMLHR